MVGLASGLVVKEPETEKGPWGKVEVVSAGPNLILPDLVTGRVARSGRPTVEGTGGLRRDMAI